MKNLNMAWRSLFKKGRNNLIKILSLGIGLALGLVLITIATVTVQSYRAATANPAESLKTE